MFRYKYQKPTGEIGYTSWFSLRYSLISDVMALFEKYKECLLDIEYK